MLSIQFIREHEALVREAASAVRGNLRFDYQGRELDLETPWRRVTVFELVSEAVGLVLHAASLAKGGDVFVLSMGDQIRVVDLARNLIRLSGFLPDDEIAIKVIGIRPGEKLSEELVGADEEAVPSGVDGILQVKPLRPSGLALLLEHIGEVERLARDGDTSAVLKMLQTIVPTYARVSEGCD